MTNKTQQNGPGFLGIYLNDHLAGSTVVLELARRIAASARHLPVSDDVPKRLAAEIGEDRIALLDIMDTLGIRIQGYKVLAAWAGEKAGRLKLNGRLLRRSPLSDLEELEMLRLGVEGTGTGWRTLRSVAERDSRLDAGRLDKLISRAARQAELLEELRSEVAERTFGTASPALPGVPARDQPGKQDLRGPAQPGRQVNAGLGQRRI
jgi:hypothetical protein